MATLLIILTFRPSHVARGSQKRVLKKTQESVDLKFLGGEGHFVVLRIILFSGLFFISISFFQVPFLTNCLIKRYI